MINVLEQAIEKIRSLPEDRQADAAEILEQMAADEGSVLKVPEEDRAAVLEGLEQLKRGDFASDDGMSRSGKNAACEAALHTARPQRHRRHSRLHRTTQSTRGNCRGSRHPQHLPIACAHPRLGRATDIKGIRALALLRYPYLIYYAIGTDAVTMLHVRHGARSAPEQSDL